MLEVYLRCIGILLAIGFFLILSFGRRWWNTASQIIFMVLVGFSAYKVIVAAHANFKECERECQSIGQVCHVSRFQGYHCE